MRRGVELVLIMAFTIGGYLAWQTGQERGRLQRTFDRLAGKAGDLEIGDPAQVHLPRSQPVSRCTSRGGSTCLPVTRGEFM